MLPPGSAHIAIVPDCFESRVLSGGYRRALVNVLNCTSDINKGIIYEFLERNLAKKGLCERRRLKYVRVVKKFLEILGTKNLTEWNIEAIETLFFWIKNNQNLADDTKEDYWKMSRIFSEFLRPEINVRSYRLHVKSKVKMPEDIFSESEVQRIIDSTYVLRNKAMLSILYHSACRPSEIINSRVKDLSFDQYGAVFQVRELGKTGARRIRLIEPVPLLATYLQQHLYREDPHAPLFYRTDKHLKEPTNLLSVNRILKQSAERAGVKKGRIYAYLLRHSKLTHLSKHLNSQEVMIYAGHKRLSTTQLYVHLSGADIDEKLLKIHGIKQENESAVNITPVKCLRCSITNDPNAKYCKSCGMVLDTKEAFDMKDTTEKDFQQFMTEMFKAWKTNNRLWTEK